MSQNHLLEGPGMYGSTYTFDRGDWSIGLLVSTSITQTLHVCHPQNHPNVGIWHTWSVWVREWKNMEDQLFSFTTLP